LILRALLAVSLVVRKIIARRRLLDTVSDETLCNAAAF
jgi:hypothetical protein